MLEDPLESDRSIILIIMRFTPRRVVTSNRFRENPVNRCMYLKVSGSQFIIMVLYVDDKIFAKSEFHFIHKTKDFLSRHFNMKDLGDAHYILRIKIF